MKLKPLEEWICDSCGEVVVADQTGSGYLQWAEMPSDLAGGFRIVHNKAGCLKQEDLPALTADIELEHWTGADGLVALMAFVDHGRYHGKNESSPPKVMLDQWAEIVRRLHVPYYEEARQYWEKAEEDGLFEDLNDEQIFYSSFLQEIIGKYA